MDVSFGKARIQLFRSLANSIRAGVSPLQAVELLAAGSSEPERSALLDIQARLRAGEPLSKGMRRHPEVFPTWQTEMTAVGESTGRLDAALATIADLLEENRAFWLGLLPNLAYPAFLLHVAPVLLSAPKAITVGAGAYVRSVLALWAAVDLPLAAAFFLLKGFFRRPRLVAKMQYCLQLSTLVKAGVAVPRALELAAAASGLEEELGAGALRFVEGQALSAKLAQLRLFDAQELSQIQVAELSGRLDEELAHVGAQARTSWQARIKSVTAVLPAVVMIVVFVLIGWQIVSTYSETLKTLTDIGK